MRPTAFRIRDFRSIVDSQVCPFSADNITVLAGQNEAGKTAILQALRDFDLDPGDKPKSTDFFPEVRFDAKPTVSVLFTYEYGAIRKQLEEEDFFVPDSVRAYFENRREVWVHRDLMEGQYYFDADIMKLWDGDPADQALKEGATTAQPTDTPAALTPAEFGEQLRVIWPLFVYFDSFQDILPREVALSSLDATTGKAPQVVRDFVVLSGLDTQKLATIEHDKSIGNYLRHCSASITGDFLNYWKQKSDGEASVDLLVKHVRNSSGEPMLAFYVHDEVDQYPEQRSKGFLWFLSFYLRLAAAQRSNTARRLLLIDEPGTYLHARAQRDVLHLFEHRLAATQQIVYSTHSPFLLPSQHLHRLRIVVKTRTQGTVVVDRLTHRLLRGDEFSDTLSPIIAAIGIDIRETLSFAKPRNLLVEGISDRLYLEAFARLKGSDLFDKVNVFPCTGAGTVPLFASLFIGWGLRYGILLDRDEKGQEIRARLMRELGIGSESIVQPHDATTIEDIISADDFRGLLAHLDPALTLNAGERPSVAVKRQRIDKVLLARKFSELQAAGVLQLTQKTTDAVNRLLKELRTALPT
jgi:predicted ATP-dependent endonuclease of OLD family